MSEIYTNTIKPETSFFINEDKYEFLSPETESTLDSKMEALKSFINDNEPNTELSEDEKDKLYSHAKELFEDLKSELTEAKFNIFFNRNEYNFITDLLINKMEYTVDTIFVAIELKNFLLNMKEVAKFKNDTEIRGFAVTPTEMTYLYHLISPHKVKGLKSDGFNFAGSIRKIADVSKVINYYDSFVKNIVGDIEKWIIKFDDINIIEEPQTQSE